MILIGLGFYQKDQRRTTLDATLGRWVICAQVRIHWEIYDKSTREIYTLWAIFDPFGRGDWSIDASPRIAVYARDFLTPANSIQISSSPSIKSFRKYILTECSRVRLKKFKCTELIEHKSLPRPLAQEKNQRATRSNANTRIMGYSVELRQLPPISLTRFQVAALAPTA